MIHKTNNYKTLKINIMKTSQSNTTVKSNHKIKKEILQLKNLYPNTILVLIDLIPIYFLFFFCYMLGADSQFWIKDYAWLTLTLSIIIPILSQVLEYWVIEKKAAKWMINEIDLLDYRFNKSYELINLYKKAKTQDEKNLLLEKINEYVHYVRIDEKSASLSYTHDKKETSVEYTWKDDIITVHKNN